MWYLFTAVFSVIDKVRKTATSDKLRRKVCNVFYKLEDEDFPDDIALVSHSHRNIQKRLVK